jgi:protein-S-isoprenylcysteine O-methyltransferase Ste14
MSVSGRVMGWRVPLGYALAALYVVLARPASLRLFFLSAGLIFLGCALRSWAAGYLVKGTRVAVGGPYAFVRNPLYAGSFLIGVGCGAALWREPLPLVSVILWLVFLGAFLAVYPAKVRAEEKELLATLGKSYADYAGKVPAFLPWRGRVPDLGAQSFSGKVYLRNREYQCLLGASGVLLLLFLRYLVGW